MKIKIFRYVYSYSKNQIIENEINQFIADKDVIDIKINYITDRQFTASSPSIEVEYTILYNEKSKE